jgi:outer membrane lipoprotein-sorting protein
MLIILFSIFLFLPSINIISLTEAQEEKTREVSDVTNLLRLLGKKISDFNNLKTDFVEEKDLAIFQKKIVLKGRVCIQKPNKIAWHVDKPIKYSVVITDTSILQWDEETNQVQEISLSQNPVFQNVLNQLTVWFTGDFTTFLEDYTIRVLRKSPFVIEFIPKEKNIAGKFVKSITITLREDERYLKQIKIQETNGDSTTITFNDTIINVPLDSLDFEVKRRV